MLSEERIREIIFHALQNLNEERADDEKIAIAADTPLFGTDAALDSLSLVSVIVDVEMALSTELGEPLSLTDDRALSQDVSPFTNPKTLAAYVVRLVSREV